MRLFVRIVLRGLVVLLPLLVTLYVVWWVVSMAETTLGGFFQQRLPDLYFPGMGIVAGLVLLFVVGLLMGVWVFNALFRWGERQIERIPLIKTLYGSMKDLMSFFPSVGANHKKGMDEVVVVSVGGMRIIGMVTRDDFSELPEDLRGSDDELLVYLPMSYQLGGFTFWVPRSAARRVNVSVAEAMRFAMTGGMSTAEPVDRISIDEDVAERDEQEDEA